MQPTDVAVIFLEVSVAVLGFAGVTVALGRRYSRASWEGFRLSTLAVSGVGAIVGSMCPIVLSVVTTRYWEYSALVLLAFLTYGLISGVRKLHSATGNFVNDWISGLVVIVNTGAIVAIVLSILMAREFLEASYLLSVAFLLLLAIRHFVALILVTGLDDDNAD
jgi:hypothetical protein